MDRRYVGIDLHRRRSVIYAMDAEGNKLFCERIDNDALRLLEVVSAAGDGAEVVIEATYGWYWAVDLLYDAGFNVHLAHPSGNDWGKRRVKNDERDARDLADLLRLGRLAEAWIAPPAVREARELVRYRARLVQLRSGLKAQVHAVMAKEGVLPETSDMFGPKGQQLLDAMELGDAYQVRVESLRDLIDGYDREVAMLERRIHELLRDDRGYQAIQALDGVGRTLSAIFVTEIGDITRFRSPEALCSWAGLTPGRNVRIKYLNQIRHLVFTAPDELRERLRDVPTDQLARTAAALRPAAGGDTVVHATKLAIATLGRRVVALETDGKRLDDALDTLVRRHAPSLLEIYGVGIHTAAILLVAAGDNPHRLRNEAAFAHLCGVAPLRASSGKVDRHRLNPGGNRQANHALWRIVFTRMAGDERTRKYVARRLAEGRSTREIMRALKRYVARELYPHLVRD